MAIRLEFFRFQIKHEVQGWVRSCRSISDELFHFTVYHRIERSSTTVRLGIIRLPRQRAFSLLSGHLGSLGPLASARSMNCAVVIIYLR